MIAGTWRSPVEGAHELASGEVKVLEESICNGNRGASKIVMTWDVVVEALMDSKQAQQVRRDLVWCGAVSSLPEESADAVCLALGLCIRGYQMSVQGLQNGAALVQAPGQN